MKTSLFRTLWINFAYISEDPVNRNDEFLHGFDEFVKELQKMEEPVTPLPILQVLEDSLMKVKKELLSALEQRPQEDQDNHHHLSPINSERTEFVKHTSPFRRIRM